MNTNLQKTKSILAFTLSEVLITLAIIGVVAAMTLPVLINKIQDSQYEKARAKILLSVGEAGRLLAVSGDISSASDAEDFVKNHLSKKLKIIQTCDAEHLEACGLLTSERIKRPDGTNYRQSLSQYRPGAPHMPSTSSWEEIKNLPGYGFVTANGYSLLLFYNPNCSVGLKDAGDPNATGSVCFDAIYDMNGLRKPNQVGKDIGFVSVLYPDMTNRAVAPSAAPVSIAGTYNWTEAQMKCSELGKEYTLPDKEELISIVMNADLLNLSRDFRWSSTSLTYQNQPSAFRVHFNEGYTVINYQTSQLSVVCIKR